MKLCIVTPIFGDAAGGAASYYNLLVAQLIDRGIVDSVTVVTEVNQTLDGGSLLDQRLKILGLFPERASGMSFSLSYSARLIWQNIKMLHPALLQEFKSADVILIHSSFFNLPNFLFFSSVGFRDKTIIDVRDTQLHRWLAWQLHAFSSFITCSENCYAHLLSYRLRRDNITKIPIPIDENKIKKSSNEIDFELCRFKKKKIFAVGLVKRAKGCLRILEAMNYVNSPNWELHFYGAIKDITIINRFGKASNIFFHGAVSSDNMLIALNDADLFVSASMSEGMPRSVLEAMFKGVKVLVPECVPEFAKFPLEHRILNSDDPLQIGRKIDYCLNSVNFANNAEYYDYSRHTLDATIPNYRRLLMAKFASVR
ncbi:glycosyltransferase family 4 protein [Gammaproteobacteria bacterium]|nr:glycosyltransferase family 4 protein [Gammaproteobacteria bacterium]